MRDIQLDKTGDLQVTNGDFAVSEGAAVVAQDIWVQTLVKQGGFFYDKECGSLIPDALNDGVSDTQLIQKELERLAINDERIDIDSVSVSQRNGKNVVSFSTLQKESSAVEV